MDQRSAKILALKFLSAFYENEIDMLEGESASQEFITSPKALLDFGFIFDAAESYLGNDWNPEYFPELRQIHQEIKAAIGH